MANFAQVENGIVVQVLPVANDAINGGVFPESEAVGREFIAAHGLEGEWFQCSVMGAFRGAFPARGWLWDGENFIAPPDPEPAPLPETKPAPTA